MNKGIEKLSGRGVKYHSPYKTQIKKIKNKREEIVIYRKGGKNKFETSDQRSTNQNSETQEILRTPIKLIQNFNRKRSVSPSTFSENTYKRFLEYEKKKIGHISELKRKKIKGENKIQKQFVSENKLKSPSGYTSLITRIDSIIYKRTERINERRMKKREEEEKSLSQYTYTPEINKEQDNGGLKRTYSDLVDWKEEKDRRLAVKIMEKNMKEMIGFRNPKKEKSIRLSRKNSKVEDRLLQSGKAKKKRRKLLEEESTKGLFHPKISQKSQEIVDRRRSNSRVSQFDPLGVSRKLQRDGYFKKNKDINSKRKKKKEKVIEKYREDELKKLKNEINNMNRGKSEKQVKFNISSKSDKKSSEAGTEEESYKFVDSKRKMKSKSGGETAKKMISSLKRALIRRRDSSKKRRKKYNNNSISNSKRTISTEEEVLEVELHEEDNHSIEEFKENEENSEISGIDSLICDRKIRENNDICLGRVGIKRAWETKEDVRMNYTVIGVENF